MNKKNVIIVALTGIAVGAALGVLFAPDKGKDLRKKISKKGEGLVDSLKDKFDGLLDGIREHLANTADAAGDMMAKAKEKSEEVKNDLKSAVN